MAEPVKFRGVVAYQRYYNEDSFWGVFNVRVKEKLPWAEEVSQPGVFEDDKDFEPYYIVCVAGKIQQLYVGSEYEFTATCQYNSKYKAWNYVPQTVTAIAPSTLEESSFFLRGILTENQADVLLKEYPSIVQDIIDGTDDVDTNRLKGIGPTTYAKIKQKIIDNYVLSDIITMLQPYGVTFNAIKSLLKWEPSAPILKQKIMQNPYCITEARGFGFATADKLALKIDPSLLHSGKRLIAYMKCYLDSVADNEGHTWIDFSELQSRISDEIPQCIDLLDKLIGLQNEGEFGGYFYINNNKIGLSKYHSCEDSIYEILKELDTYKYLGKINTDVGIKVAEAELGYSLSEDQREIVKQIETNNVVIFTGKAGSGKTSSAKAILNSFIGANIACCSLSAKAAQRIQEATGFEAMTIHRLLGYNGNVFAFDANERLNYDVIFLDEASMVNCSLFYHLISAIKEGAKFIMCGDYAQLPPIGAGNIFADLLHMQDTFNVSILKKVHRQAEASGILSDANKIRDGIYPIDAPKPQILNGELQDMAYVFREDQNRIQDIVVDQFMKIVNKHGLDNVVIAVPRKDQVLNSALEINKQIQMRIIDTENTEYVQGISNKFYIGDRILHTENDSKRDIYNGEVGYVIQVFPNAQNDMTCMVARFKTAVEGKTKDIKYNREQLSSVLLGYCMTTHKLQGSEYNYVLVALDMSHYTLLDRCMLYTSITRAKKKCILVSQPNAFKMAMKINKTNDRQTWLSILSAQKEDDDLLILCNQV